MPSEAGVQNQRARGLPCGATYPLCVWRAVRRALSSHASPPPVPATRRHPYYQVRDCQPPVTEPGQPAVRERRIRPDLTDRRGPGPARTGTGSDRRVPQGTCGLRAHRPWDLPAERLAPPVAHAYFPPRGHLGLDAALFLGNDDPKWRKVVPSGEEGWARPVSGQKRHCTSPYPTSSWPGVA